MRRQPTSANSPASHDIQYVNIIWICLYYPQLLRLKLWKYFQLRSSWYSWRSAVVTSASQDYKQLFDYCRRSHLPQHMVMNSYESHAIHGSLSHLRSGIRTHEDYQLLNRLLQKTVEDTNSRLILVDVHTSLNARLWTLCDWKRESRYPQFPVHSTPVQSAGPVSCDNRSLCETRWHFGAARPGFGAESLVWSFILARVTCSDECVHTPINSLTCKSALSNTTAAPLEGWATQLQVRALRWKNVCLWPLSVILYSSCFQKIIVL